MSNRHTVLSDVWCVPHGGQQQVWSTVQCIEVVQAWRLSECSLSMYPFSTMKNNHIWGWTRRPSRCKVLGNRSEMTWFGGIFFGHFLGDEMDYSVSPSLWDWSCLPAWIVQIQKSRWQWGSSGCCTRYGPEDLGRRMHDDFLDFPLWDGVFVEWNGGGYGSQVGLVYDLELLSCTSEK